MKIDFDKGDGLVPAIVQDAKTQKVLMLGYMNKDALEKTQESKKVTFFSRSKQRLWTKGETSGNFLHLKSITVDCDHDTLLIAAIPEGPACHTGDDTCFQQINQPNAFFLEYLESIIKQRKTESADTSYTASLFQKGINKIAQKVGEEAVELVIEAMDNNDDLFIEEASDLLFHYLVLLQAKGFHLNDVILKLSNRHK